MSQARTQYEDQIDTFERLLKAFEDSEEPAKISAFKQLNNYYKLNIRNVIFLLQSLHNQDLHTLSTNLSEEFINFNKKIDPTYLSKMGPGTQEIPTTIQNIRNIMTQLKSHVQLVQAQQVSTEKNENREEKIPGYLPYVGTGATIGLIIGGIIGGVLGFGAGAVPGALIGAGIAAAGPALIAITAGIFAVGAALVGAFVGALTRVAQQYFSPPKLETEPPKTQEEWKQEIQKGKQVLKDLDNRSKESLQAFSPTSTTTLVAGRGMLGKTEPSRLPPTPATEIKTESKEEATSTFDPLSKGLGFRTDVSKDWNRLIMDDVEAKKPKTDPNELLVKQKLRVKDLESQMKAAKEEKGEKQKFKVIRIEADLKSAKIKEKDLQKEISSGKSTTKKSQTTQTNVKVFIKTGEEFQSLSQMPSVQEALTLFDQQHPERASLQTDNRPFDAKSLPVFIQHALLNKVEEKAKESLETNKLIPFLNQGALTQGLELYVNDYFSNMLKKQDLIFRPNGNGDSLDIKITFIPTSKGVDVNLEYVTREVAVMQRNGKVEPYKGDPAIEAKVTFSIDMTTSGYTPVGDAEKQVTMMPTPFTITQKDTLFNYSNNKKFAELIDKPPTLKPRRW